MKRRIVLVLIIAGVLAVGGLGTWWWLNRSSGEKLLARAGVAILAKNYENAAALAKRYAEAHPHDARGYLVQAEAYLYLNQYDQARAVLQQGAQAKPGDPNIQAALANTYAFAARRALDSEDARRRPDLLRAAVDQLAKAEEILRQVAPPDDNSALKLAEEIGLVQIDAGVGLRYLADRFQEEARLAASAGNTSQETERRQAAEEAAKQADQRLSEGRASLLKVVQQDVARHQTPAGADLPVRERAANRLVQLALNQRDDAALAAARESILALKTPPPLAVALLLMHEVEAAVDDPEKQRSLVTNASARLDAIIEGQAKHPDLVRVRLIRTELGLRLKDFATAENHLQAILKDDPRSPEARLAMANLRLRRAAPGDVVHAERELFALTTDFPNWPDAHFTYAHAAMALGKRELAKQAFRKTADLDKNHVGARLSMAESLAAEGFYDQAFMETKIARDALKDAAVFQRFGGLQRTAEGLFVETATRTKQPSAALEALRAVDDAAVYRRFFRAAADTGQQDLIREALKTAQDDPRFAGRPEIWLALSEGWGLLGQADAARAAATKAAEMKPETAAQRLAVAQALFAIGKAAAAESMLAEAMAADPASAVPHAALAELYAKTRRPMQAIEEYRAALQRAPQDLGSRIGYARVLAEVGLLDEARGETERALEQAPANAEAEMLDIQIRIRRGDPLTPEQQQKSPTASAVTYLQTGEPQRAVELCLARLKQDPNDLDTRWLLGQAYLTLGRSERDLGTHSQKGLDEWTAVLKAAPDRRSVYYDIGALLMSKGKSPADTEGLLANVPGARREYVDFALGRLLAQSRQFEAAADAYGRIASRQDVPVDDRHLARSQRARCLALAGHLDRAMAELDQIPEAKPWGTLRDTERALILAGTGRPEEAGATLLKIEASAIQAKEAAVLGRLCMLRIRLSHAPRALELTDELRRLSPRDPQPYILRAAALATLGRHEEAIQAYRDAVDLQPGNFTLRVTLAKALNAAGHPMEALQTLNELKTHGEFGLTASLAEQSMLFVQWGLQAEAIRCLEELARKRSTVDPQLRLFLGQSLARLGQTDRAREELAKVPDYAPQYLAAQQSLAALAPSVNEKLDILRKAEAAHPQLVNLRAQRIDILLKEGKADEAAQEFQGYLKGVPQGAAPAEPVALLGIQAMVRTGERRAAAALSAQMSTVFRSPPWRRLAVLLTSDNNPGTAQSMLPPIAEADYYDALLGLSLADAGSDAMKKWKDRMVQIEARLAQATPPVPTNPMYRALCALTAGAIPEAESILANLGTDDLATQPTMRELVTAAKANPAALRTEAAQLLKAMVAQELNIPELSREWARQALKARPTSQWAAALAARGVGDPAALRDIADTLKPEDSSVARMIRADLLTLEGQHRKAAELYGLAAQAENGNPILLLNQGTAAERAGQFADAINLYRQVYEKAKVPIAANNAAYLVSQMYPTDKARLEEAFGWVEAALKAQPDMAAFYDTKGWIAFQLGRNDEALADLRQAVKRLPDSPEVHYHLGAAESQAGNALLARWHLEAAVALGTKMKAGGKEVPKAAEQAIRLAGEALLKLPEPPK